MDVPVHVLARAPGDHGGALIQNMDEDVHAPYPCLIAAGIGKLIRAVGAAGIAERADDFPPKKAA